MCNLLQNIATKQVKKSCCEFHHLHSNLSCNKSVYCLFCTYLNSDWMKLHRGYTIHRSYVIGCKKSLSWARKTRNKQRFCCKKYNYFLLSATTLCTLRQPDLSEDRIESGQQNAQLCFSTCFAAMLQNKLHSYQLPLGPMYTNRQSSATSLRWSQNSFSQSDLKQVGVS